jgi:hypothetical protein
VIWITIASASEIIGEAAYQIRPQSRAELPDLPWNKSDLDIILLRPEVTDLPGAQRRKISLPVKTVDDQEFARMIEMERKSSLCSQN